MNNEKYISPTLVSKQFGVTSGALRRWAEAGKIRYLRPNTTSERGGRRIYNVEDIKKIAEKKKIELGVSDKAGLGKFMGLLMKEFKGKADGNDVKEVVESLFT